VQKWLPFNAARNGCHAKIPLNFQSLHLSATFFKQYFLIWQKFFTTDLKRSTFLKYHFSTFFHGFLELVNA
jgi:hypothetical protein